MAGGFQADGRISYSSMAWFGMYLEVWQTCLRIGWRIGMNSTLLANEEKGRYDLCSGCFGMMKPMDQVWNGILSISEAGVRVVIWFEATFQNWASWEAKDVLLRWFLKWFWWQYDLEFLAQFEIGGLWNMLNKSFRMWWTSEFGGWSMEKAWPAAGLVMGGVLAPLGWHKVFWVVMHLRGKLRF